MSWTSAMRRRPIRQLWPRTVPGTLLLGQRSAQAVTRRGMACRIPTLSVTTTQESYLTMKTA